MRKLNPKWVAYVNLMSEGNDDGFEARHAPMPKYLDEVKPAVSALAATSGYDPLVKAQDGNMIRRSKLAAQLEADRTRLPNITNEYGRQIVQAAIDHAVKVLAE